jgi:tryptophan synthase beta chain
MVFTIHITVHQRAETLYDAPEIPLADVETLQAIEPKTKGANASDVKIVLGMDELPRAWYNILPDLPAPFPPYLHPGTKEPVPPQAFEPLFPKELIRQEMSPNRLEPIPEELREAYLRLGRPTPLYRAKRLEAFLRTPARIYYKREDLSPVGSHKPNTAFAQAYFAAKEGVESLATETGAGQWGSALALATNYFGLHAKIFMVRVSYDQKPYRKHMMRLFGADVVPSPSDRTNIGKKILAQDPDHPGSLGIAISEAIETAVTSPNTRYSLGSVLNHVLMHQTIIGLETRAQFELADIEPDFMVGSVGGGSNFGGFTYPTIGERIHGRSDTRFVAVEPTSVPSMTQGRYEYDFGDTGEMTPLVKMHTLGHTFVPPRIHAGGLRYHGTAATLSVLLDAGLVEPRAVDQVSTFQAGEIFAKTEGLIPAPETCHAIRGAIDLALEAKAKNEERVIAFNYSGHGLLDMEGYAAYLAGTLQDNGHVT